MRLRWTARAQRDLLAIADYISQDSPEAARVWVEKLRERARRATGLPRAGRVVPELARSDVREVFLRTYRIVYAIHDEAIDVLTVFEGDRPFPEEEIAGEED